MVFIIDAYVFHERRISFFLESPKQPTTSCCFQWILSFSNRVKIQRNECPRNFHLSCPFWNLSDFSLTFAKSEIRTFHNKLLQQQKCTKKREARAKLLFCHLNLLPSCHSHRPRPRPSSLNDKGWVQSKRKWIYLVISNTESWQNKVMAWFVPGVWWFAILKAHIPTSLQL